MEYSVCIDALFRGQDPAESAGIVRDCGYAAVEFWSWWDKDLPALRAACRRTGLRVAAFCARFIEPGDPANRDAYLLGLKESLEAARYLDCPTLIAQAGYDQPRISREAHRENLRELYARAAPLLEEAGVTLVVEPLNVKVDHPGYHLVHADEAFALIEEVGSPRVKLLYDIYHQQISDGNIADTIRTHLDRIGHFHAAAVPGRTEPTGGELNYPWIFQTLKELGYAGYMGLEYMPRRDAAETLRELRPML